MRLNYLRKLLALPGYCIAKLAIEPRRGQQSVILELKRLPGPHACGQCGRSIRKSHSNWWIEVQHLHLWQYPTFLRVRRFRADCPECGLVLEPLPFAMDGPMVTRSLSALVTELCKAMTSQAVGVLLTLHNATVKTIDKRAIAKVQAERPLDGITVLGADECGVGKGHKLWSFFSALEGPRGPEMLYIVEGRTEKKLKSFWLWFGKERAVKITHAVLDMCRTFANSFRKHCPGVQIIFDKFHVMRHLNGALNEVRKAELGHALGRFKKTLSGKKFILMARRSRVLGKAREALDLILSASPKLYKAHLLKESFGHMWDYSYKGCARRFWADWKAELKWTRMKSYWNFVKMVERHLDGILAYCDKKVSLGYIESANLKARNVIRRAYGYRDKDYMKLKIIQACTPWMGKFHPWDWIRDHKNLR